MKNDKYNIPYRASDSLIGKPLQSEPDHSSENSKFLKKNIKKSVLPFSLIGIILASSQIKETETLSLKYQGWYPLKEDGKNVLVFDENKIELRGGKDPAYEIWNYPESLDLDTLEMQRRYKVTLEKYKIGFLFPDKITSIESEVKK